MSPTSNREIAVARSLDRVPQLAMLPSVAMRVMNVAADPNATPRAMAEVVAHSPELCARILRIVNSALFGFPREVTSIDRAIALMGMESVKNVAVAASVAKAFHGGPLTPAFGPQSLWLHSVTVAGAARLVAKTLRRAPVDEAFLAGLIHDIGHMVQLQAERARLAMLLKQLETDTASDLLEREEALFQATHQHFGLGLAERWNLPRMFLASTAGHHHPLDIPREYRWLATVVHIADRLAIRHQPAYPLDSRTATIDDDILDDAHLTRAALETIAEQLPAVVNDATQYLAA